MKVPSIGGVLVGRTHAKLSQHIESIVPNSGGVPVIRTDSKPS